MVLMAQPNSFRYPSWKAGQLGVMDDPKSFAISPGGLRPSLSCCCLNLGKALLTGTNFDGTMDEPAVLRPGLHVFRTVPPIVVGSDDIPPQREEVVAAISRSWITQKHRKI